MRRMLRWLRDGAERYEARAVARRLWNVHRIRAVAEQIDINGEARWVVTVTSGATSGWSYNADAHLVRKS